MSPPLAFACPRSSPARPGTNPWFIFFCSLSPTVGGILGAWDFHDGEKERPWHNEYESRSSRGRTRCW